MGISLINRFQRLNKINFMLLQGLKLSPNSPRAVNSRCLSAAGSQKGQLGKDYATERLYTSSGSVWALGHSGLELGPMAVAVSCLKFTIMWRHFSNQTSLSGGYRGLDDM